MIKVCKRCARPLRDKMIMKRGRPVKVRVCRSPICPAYDRPQ